MLDKSPYKTCQYIEGDVLPKGRTQYCKAPTAEHSSYCRKHFNICFNVPTQTEQARFNHQIEALVNENRKFFGKDPGAIV